MTTIAVSRETRPYWDYIKNASDETKLALITLLTSSVNASKGMTPVKPRPIKAHRRNVVTDEDMEKVMAGEPIPVSSDCDTDLSDIVRANKGRIVKGLEKWL